MQWENDTQLYFMQKCYQKTICVGIKRFLDCSMLCSSFLDTGIEMLNWKWLSVIYTLCYLSILKQSYWTIELFIFWDHKSSYWWKSAVIMCVVIYWYLEQTLYWFNIRDMLFFIMLWDFMTDQSYKLMLITNQMSYSLLALIAWEILDIKITYFWLSLHFSLPLQFWPDFDSCNLKNINVSTLPCLKPWDSDFWIM